MAATSKQQVSFCHTEHEDDKDNSSSGKSFYEITTSEAESLGRSSSDEEDTSRLDLIIQGAYTCNPSYFSSFPSEAAQRNSLLLFDKDLHESYSSGITAYL